MNSVPDKPPCSTFVSTFKTAAVCAVKINMVGACTNKMYSSETRTLIFIMYTEILISRDVSAHVNTPNINKTGIRLSVVSDRGD